MSNPWVRAAGIYLAFWVGMFLLGRVMHRAKKVGFETEPERRSATEDALHALWMAWLFAATPVLQLFRPESPFAEVFVLAVGGALPLGVPHFIYRRRMKKDGGGADG